MGLREGGGGASVCVGVCIAIEGRRGACVGSGGAGVLL